MKEPIIDDNGKLKRGFYALHQNSEAQKPICVKRPCKRCGFPSELVIGGATLCDRCKQDDKPQPTYAELVAILDRINDENGRHYHIDEDIAKDLVEILGRVKR